MFILANNHCLKLLPAVFIPTRLKFLVSDGSTFMYFVLPMIFSVSLGELVGIQNICAV